MNKVVHFEIPVDNLDRAKKFYSSIFGWEIQDIPEMDYTIVWTVKVDDQRMPIEKGAINGGFMKRGNHVRWPVLTLQVDSIDDTIKKVMESGGSLVEPKMSVGNMGYAAYIKDSENNIIGLWESIAK